MFEYQVFSNNDMCSYKNKDLYKSHQTSKCKTAIIPARDKTFIKYARVIFLLSGGSSSYRNIRGGWNGSRIYVAWTASSISTEYVLYSGGVRTRYHNGIVHNLGAVFCSQRQTKGNYQIRTVVIILHAFIAFRTIRYSERICDIVRLTCEKTINYVEIRFR